MAAKVCVPCDFGVENLYDPFHGNVDVEFSDESKLRVNSLILSWNSDTFSHFFNELRLTNIEIKDFSKVAVMVFLESMYCGDIKLEKDIFREIYKLSLVFKSKWLADKCREYFCLMCENITNEFEELVFVFNEAMYAKTTLITADFIEIVVNRFSGIENIENLFVKRYLQDNYTSISPAALEHLLLLNMENFYPVITVIKQHLSEGDIDNTTRSLLSNSEIEECFAHHMECYGEIYELLVLKTDDMSLDDFKMLANLNVSVIKASRSLSKAEKEQVALLRVIPNLYHEWRLYSVMSVEELITSVPHMSVFMLIEWGVFFPDVLPNITQICTAKSLCRVPPVFVQSFCTPGWLTDLHQTVVSEDDTAVIIGTETNLFELVTTAKSYKFYFKHPASPRCENEAQCGFMLRVTPCSKTDTGTFNIELVTEEYPADIHCHEISAAHMHLAVEWYAEHEGRFINSCISWFGKPEYSERGVEWGGMLCDNFRVRLVVYYDVRDRN